MCFSSVQSTDWVTDFTQETFSSFPVVGAIPSWPWICFFFFFFLQNQAKLFIEQKKIPFPVDNHNTNEELGKFAWRLNENFIYFWTDLHVFDASSIITPSVSAAIGYVLIGNGLYDEAIKHFSLLLQVCVCVCATFTLSTSLFYLCWSHESFALIHFVCFDKRATRSWSAPSMGEG